MRSRSPEPDRVWRVAPPGVVAEAVRHPGGSVYEIDARFVDDPDGYIPPEAIKGEWVVDKEGRPTGEYRPNPQHGPPQDNLSKLTDPDSWLGWLGDDPAAAVRGSIADLLEEQVAGARLVWLKVIDSPRYLTGVKPASEPDHYVVTRAAIAIEFALSVAWPPRETLTGVFSWIAMNLDRPDERRDRVWLDLGAELDWAEQQLETRIDPDD